MMTKSMLSRKANLRSAIAAAVLVTAMVYAFPVTARAAQASPAADISPGTVITNQNWERYRAFMSEGLIALFEGSHYWHMPAGLELEVGPTKSIPLPKQYLEDTARYSNRVQLTPTAEGGYVSSGYVAGLPFPHPLEGDAALIGQRIFWDSYYRYQPRVQWAPTFTYRLD